MKRFVMRLTGEKSEVIYETRNTQKKKQKNKVYVYIYISCPRSNSSLRTP